jgi:GTP-binding protein
VGGSGKPMRVRSGDSPFATSSRSFLKYVGSSPLSICSIGHSGSITRSLRMSGAALADAAASDGTPGAEHPLRADLVEEIPTDTTLGDFNEHIKALGSKKAVRKLVEVFLQCEDNQGQFAHLCPNTDSYRIAVQSLVRSGRADLGIELYKRRMVARELRPDLVGPDASLGSSLIRAVLRDGKKRQLISDNVVLLFDELTSDCMADAGKSSATAARSAASLLSVTGAFLDAGMENRAVAAVKTLKALSLAAGEDAAVDQPMYNNAIRLLGKKRRLDGVFVVLDAMRAAQVPLNNETFEFLANSAVRQVEFVTGAVSMDTLPTPLGAEIAFVGRSNVGKSSLVNMICNRKALAYVSGRPGKTQQFNYFLVNGTHKASAFYLVDLPGVGYAKVPKDVQAVWLKFMDDYLAQRTSLEVVFHLIDGRHGALADDEQLMSKIGKGRFSGQYVIVITKVDKLEKQKVRNIILDKTRLALKQNGCSSSTPILLTSSATRLGRDEIWRYLQSAIKL